MCLIKGLVHPKSYNSAFYILVLFWRGTFTQLLHLREQFGVLTLYLTLLLHFISTIGIFSLYTQFCKKLSDV